MTGAKSLIRNDLAHRRDPGEVIQVFDVSDVLNSRLLDVALMQASTAPSTERSVMRRCDAFRSTIRQCEMRCMKVDAAKSGHELRMLKLVARTREIHE